MTILDDIKVAELEAAIGRRRVLRQRLDEASLIRFAAAVGANPLARPPLAHWAFFHDIAPDGKLGPDGHPKPGDFLPVAPGMPRRMFASTIIRFGGPLLLDEDAEMTLEIADVRHKRGRGGDLLFVDVERLIEQGGRLRVQETQTLVYRAPASAAPVLPTVADDAAQAPEGGQLWQPSPTNLFRFSAATFNGHRIHYDRPYATEVEGYPDLIVHGPFLAAKLAALAERRGPLVTFQFRALAPVFVDQPIRLAEVTPGETQAIRCDGTVAVTAKATYQ